MVPTWPTRRRALLALMAALALAAVPASALVKGLASASPVAPSTGVVVAGVSQWGALARAVAGPHVQVVSLLTDPNADPHDHEATVADARQVARAVLVVENGAGYDTWLAKLVSARALRPAVLNVSTELAHAGPRANPHLFYDLAYAHAFVGYVADRLSMLDLAARVRANAARVEIRVAGLQARVARIAAACHGVRVAATEDVAGYLLAEMGLRVVTPRAFRLAVGNGVDPSVRDLATALAQLRRHPALLVDNVQTQTPLTTELVNRARSLGVPVVEVTETMTGRDYVVWMASTLARVEAALRHQGCLA
jgi:zinc/manganese transport system substrate-binding protein